MMGHTSSVTAAVLLLLVVTLASVSPPAAAYAQQKATSNPGSTKLTLRQCLQRDSIHVVTPDNPEYERARRTLSKFSNNYPVAVVYPASTEQVQAAIKCARAARVKVLPRCGGHGNEGESVETGAITLDMQKMSRVSVASDHNSAWVQGGAQVGKLLSVVIKETNMTRGFPGGVRPTVGVAGYILGGGFGGFTRFAGLGADNLIAIKGVDANGQVVVADKDNNPELLWASRGAGGGKFVVVTDFHVRLMDVTPGVTNFNYTVPYDQAIDAMLFYQKWAPTLPDIITHRAGIRPDRKSKMDSFYVGGRYMGSIADAKKALIASGLHDSGVLHVDNFTFKHTDYLEAVEESIGFKMPPGPDRFTVLEERKYWEFEYAWSYKFRSLIVDTPLPREYYQTALEFAQFPGAEIDYQALGGAVSKVPKDATAAGHLRTGHFVVIVRGTKEASDNKVTSAAGQTLPQSVQACPAVSNEVMAGNVNASLYVQKLAAFVPEVKSYINFRDTDLPTWTPDYLASYYGDQLTALECVKLKYDPDTLFNLPMDIQPPKGSSSHCPELLKRVGTAAANYSRYLLASGPARAAPASSAQAQTKQSASGGGAKQPARTAAEKGVAVAAGRKLAHHWHLF